jgi:hypothetical protein
MLFRVNRARFERVPESSASPPIAAVPLRRSERRDVPITVIDPNWIELACGRALFSLRIRRLVI